MEKMDARKRYTQMVLKQSFLKLLKEKPVNRITVKEVCALAQLTVPPSMPITAIALP